MYPLHPWYLTSFSRRLLDVVGRCRVVLVLLPLAVRYTNTLLCFQIAIAVGPGLRSLLDNKTKITLIIFNFTIRAQLWNLDHKDFLSNLDK